MLVVLLACPVFASLVVVGMTAIFWLWSRHAVRRKLELLPPETAEAIQQGQQGDEEGKERPGELLIIEQEETEMEVELKPRPRSSRFSFIRKRFRSSATPTATAAAPAPALAPAPAPAPATAVGAAGPESDPPILLPPSPPPPATPTRPSHTHKGNSAKASLRSLRPDDIKGLSKEEFLELFRLLPPATLQQLEGEWEGELLAMGLSFPLAYLFWHWRLGKGWFLGKGFFRNKNENENENEKKGVEEEATGGGGFNVFYNHGVISRSRRFDCWSGPSAYVESEAKKKDSLHLVYARYNDRLFRQLHEELRCVHEGLFIGFGSIGGLRGRTPLNSIPFLLKAPKTKLMDNFLDKVQDRN